MTFRTTKILVFSDLNVYKTLTNSFGTLPNVLRDKKRAKKEKENKV
jgi:hypothetical protein